MPNLNDQQLIERSKDINHLEKDVANLQEKIKEILINKPKSIITKFSNWWSSLPLWKKIVYGSIPVVLLLTSGLLPIAPGGVVGFALGVGVTATAGILMDDHTKNEKNKDESMQEIVGTIGDSLKVLVNNFNNIYEKMTKAIDKFSTENIKLNEQIETFTSQIQTFSTENQSLTAQVQLFASNNTELNTQVVDLTAQNLVLKEIANQITTLNATKENLEKEINKLQRINSTLTATIKEVTDSFVEDQSQKKEFSEKLKNFIENKDASFAQIASRICKAEEERDHIRAEFERNNNRYNELLQKHEMLINLQSQSLRNDTPNLALLTNGLFASANESFNEEEKNNCELKHY